jgi:hypothetical protein
MVYNAAEQRTHVAGDVAPVAELYVLAGQGIG